MYSTVNTDNITHLVLDHRDSLIVANLERQHQKGILSLGMFRPNLVPAGSPRQLA